MNDWFIEKDGKQYRDDPILTDLEVEMITDHITGALDPSTSLDAFQAAVDKACDAGEAEKVRLALIRRRKAREACYKCPIRLACLDSRLENRVEYGTWGGYYPEELRKIDEERDRRARLRP